MKTPQTEAPALARALGLVAQVYLKREDLHKYGSHKGRSIPHMIKVYAKEAVRDFVISSSGNAALAAIHTVLQYNKNSPQVQIKLQVCVGKYISYKKYKKLSDLVMDIKHINIDKFNNPKQVAFEYAKEPRIIYLRQSTDDLALEGYSELAQELNKIQNLQAIFIPTSSGTTAQALEKAFRGLRSASPADGQMPEIHIVQTVACHPIAIECLATTIIPPLVGGNEGVFTKSIASAIVDRVAHRKDKVIEVVKNSGGAGWIVSDEEIEDAITLAQQTCGLTISPNSALAIAGLKKAVANGFNFSGSVVCLITGA